MPEADRACSSVDVFSLRGSNGLRVIPSYVHDQVHDQAPTCGAKGSTGTVATQNAMSGIPDE
jgi:hypothetical protein